MTKRFSKFYGKESIHEPDPKREPRRIEPPPSTTNSALAKLITTGRLEFSPKVIALLLQHELDRSPKDSKPYDQEWVSL